MFEIEVKVLLKDLVAYLTSDKDIIAQVLAGVDVIIFSQRFPGPSS